MSRAKIETSHQYVVAFVEENPKGVWEYVKLPRKHLQSWLDYHGIDFSGDIYSGWNVSVHPDMRGKGLATKMTDAMVSHMKPGDILTLSSLEPDGAAFIKKWFSVSNVNWFFSDEPSYDPNRINLIVKGRDRGFYWRS